MNDKRAVADIRHFGNWVSCDCDEDDDWAKLSDKSGAEFEQLNPLRDCQKSRSIRNCKLTLGDEK